ncbi:MAG: M56 family metallopeptidase [Eubacteriales bacterium]|nr:M56 family metallopeptidase [Eubacteriales bacterium]
MMEAAFSALVKCSVTMCVMTLLYAALSPMLAKRYAPRWRHLIWLAIALGYLCPLRPALELPLLPAPAAQMAVAPVARDTAAEPAPKISPEALTVTHGTAPGTLPHIPAWVVAPTIYLAGAAFMLGFHAVRHLRFLRIVRRWGEAVTAPEMLNLLDRLKDRLGIRQSVGLKTCPGISSPMLVGLLHPVILLPPISLSADEWARILQHELIHVKHHDLLGKALILAATVLHWFNPAVYLMARASQLACEAACDARVLRDADAGARRQYGETILRLVRHASAPQTVLSTNFYGGKRAMKHRIAFLLDNTHKRTGALLLCVVLAAMLLTGATLAPAEAAPTSIPGTAFTQREYDKLLALRFDGYEDMSVAQFRERVWVATDTPEYPALLERFCEDDQLRDMSDTNDIARFIFDELKPLTSPVRSSIFFRASVPRHFDGADDARLEYSGQIEIADAAKLTVRAYGEAKKGFMADVEAFVNGLSEAQLRDGPGANQAIDSEIARLTAKWSGDALSIRIEEPFFFFPLTGGEPSEAVQSGSEREARRLPRATEADYRALLTLMTADYSDRTLADFNADLLEWANGDFNRMERITADSAYGDAGVTLSPDERAFVRRTVRYSGDENAAMIRSLRTGEPELDVEFVGSFGVAVEPSSWWNLSYRGGYHIPDKTKVTVGERDRALGAVTDGIIDHVLKQDVPDLTSMDDEAVYAHLARVAAQFSDDRISISIPREQVKIEKLREHLEPEAETFQVSDEQARAELVAGRTYSLENPTEKDQYARLLSVTLHPDGSAVLAIPPISSYVPPKCVYSIENGELLICAAIAPEAGDTYGYDLKDGDVIARFTMEDTDLLIFQSSTVPLFAAKGARYTASPASAGDNAAKTDQPPHDYKIRVDLSEQRVYAHQ